MSTTAERTARATDVTHERALWRAGYDLIAGIDEVGRGALAGPLVAAAVVLPRPRRHDQEFWTSLCDSKLLTPAQRARACAEITARAVGVGIGSVDQHLLDQIGISAANRLAMEQAVLALPCLPDALLLDAVVIDLGLPQIGLIDGDAQSASIAAASIVAKVTRDTLMIASDSSWPVYGFGQHKGYGVARHLAALREHGPCPLHRRSFAPVQLACGGAHDDA